MSLHRRAVRVHLRGGVTLRGRIHVAEGQSLCGFLSAGRFFLNLTGVRIEDDQQGEELPHLSVRLRQIVWVEPLDPALRLSSAAVPSEERRGIELHLEGGHQLRVELNVSSETRMSDYLDANPWFIPLWYVRISGEEQVVERVALNHFAILTIREVDPA